MKNPESVAMRLCRTTQLLVAALVILATQGCMFSRLDQELKTLDKVHVINGKITNPGEGHHAVVVLVLRQSANGPQLYRASIVNTPPWRFVLELPEGSYQLLAFEDIDNDLRCDATERTGKFGKPDRIEIKENSPSTLSNLDITFGKNSGFADELAKDQEVSPEILQESYIKIGRIAALDNRLFSPEYGSKGYWEPLSFIREVGFGIYFLVKYAPDKIPVLFIHGALGTPAGWASMINRIGRDRFQPWLYYYPSGLGLEDSSKALNKMILELHRHYRFKKMYVIAHSMGGLVARSFILQNYHESRQQLVRRFIAIATPWNGHKLTAKGVSGAPTAIPSWYDMVPDSPFIHGLYSRPLPPSLEYFLMFSYRGDCSIFLDNNDGTIELSSLLDLRAQEEANRLFGYDEDHGSILESREVLSQIIHLLSKVEE